MEYRKVGRTGLRVSPVCLGTMTFGDQVNEPDAIAMTHAVLDAGVNFVDTANMYADGRSEEIVGKAIKGRRNDVVLATKVGVDMSTRPNECGLSRKHIMRAVEDSLRRLDTDYIDIYYIHRPDYSTPIEETLRTMDNLVRQGKVRYLGCSNLRAFQISKALWTSDTLNLERFECLQTPYNVLTRDIEYEVLPLCSDEGLGVTIYNPLAGGLLTGKHAPGKAPAQGTRFSNERQGKQYTDRYWNQDNFDAVERFRALATAHNRDMAQMALAFVLANPTVTSLIMGATSMKHVEHNIAAVNITLTKEEMDGCDEIWHALRPLRFFYGR
jgi:aryl-alcohol dehydrogenase-like predicted oxidoreductase